MSMGLDTSADRGETTTLPSYIGMAEAGRRLGSNRDGKPIGPATVTRYGLKGIPSHQRPGTQIRLRLARFPGRWMTTEAWLAEFVATITADRDEGDGPPIQADTSTPAHRKAAEATGRALDAAGIR